MRRIASLLTFLLFLGIVAVMRFYPQFARWSSAPEKIERNVSPVPVPGSALVEGPYFSDGDRVADRVIAAINQTRKSLHVAIYDLTHPDIAAALDNAHRRGIEILIVADERQSREPHSEVPYLRAQGISIRVSRGYRGNRSIMHNKFAVFDGRLAETGSFNWTTSAAGYNYENALFIADPNVVARFEAEFQRIWAQAE